MTVDYVCFDFVWVLRYCITHKFYIFKLVQYRPKSLAHFKTVWKHFIYKMVLIKWLTRPQLHSWIYLFILVEIKMSFISLNITTRYQKHYLLILAYYVNLLLEHYKFISNYRLIITYRSLASHQSEWSSTVQCLSRSWCHRSSQSWLLHPSCRTDRNDRS